LLLFDLNLKIKKVKILIYRENYGGEISSKRWLSQFIESPEDDSFVYGDNISAISGATISVKSITESINEVMVSLKRLESEKQI
jgi:Na+-translocating ferredoxin:NAD+ oxidoreductase RnfG subunit